MTLPDPGPLPPEPAPEPAPEPGPPCPLCGVALTTPPKERPYAPPWLCVWDSRGWEDVELSKAAREAFRPAFRDFGDGLTGRFIADQAQAAAQERTRRRVAS